MALTNVCQADNIKNTSPKCNFTDIFCNLFSLWAPPMISRSASAPAVRRTAGALADPQMPARASHVYTTDARMGGIGRLASTGDIDRVASAGCPPQQKSWLRRCDRQSLRDTLDVCIDLLNYASHPDGALMNITTGKITQLDVNADMPSSLDIGQWQLRGWTVDIIDRYFPNSIKTLTRTQRSVSSRLYNVVRL